MNATALTAPRFVRRTQLGQHEYRKNFRQIDDDVITAVTSAEADAVTPLMSKIYLKLVHAPSHYRERDGVLHFRGEVRNDTHVTAWSVLCELVGVASATAGKALRWMHEQGVIGYFSGKNGVGIRIFLNRASSSIGTRGPGQKILAFPPTSSEEHRTSPDEAAFMDSYAARENPETDVKPRAPKNGAERPPVVKNQSDLTSATSTRFGRSTTSGEGAAQHTSLRVEVSVEEIVSRLRQELEPSLQSAAKRAAAQEHERTREWLESRGLPKAARVAQREAFNVLRKYGVVTETAWASNAKVGGDDYIPPGPHALSDDEVAELAEACVAMLEVKGQAVEITLAEMSVAAGGFLLPEDAPRVSRRVDLLLGAPPATSSSVTS